MLDVRFNCLPHFFAISAKLDLSYLVRARSWFPIGSNMLTYVSLNGIRPLSAWWFWLAHRSVSLSARQSDRETVRQQDRQTDWHLFVSLSV